jgi:hypothetical protein
MMTRSSSTGDIKYQHMRMNGDHIIVVIPKHKGDRCGDKPTEKTMYANPTCPQICPFLALGIILLSREVYNEFDSVLLGTRTDENINIWLKNNFGGQQELINGSHLTSHCTRKGSTSYVVSLPGLSNVIACWLRAGWQLGGVLPKYITVEMGGDQTVSGISWTVLPPYFLFAPHTEINVVLHFGLIGWKNCMRITIRYLGLYSFACKIPDWFCHQLARYRF